MTWSRCDLRALPAAALAWAACAWLVGQGSVWALAVAVGALVVSGALYGVLTRWLSSWRVPIALAALCLAAIATSVSWRLATVEASPLVAAGQARQVATLYAQVTQDPVEFERFGAPSYVVHVRVLEFEIAGHSTRGRASIVAFMQDSDGLVVGRRVRLRGRLGPADGTAHAAVMTVQSSSLTGSAAWWWEAAQTLREGVRTAASGLSPEPRGLVPALVDGDVTGISDQVEQDFQRSGLTHLMAVSGTNLTIMLAGVLLLARGCGARRRTLVVLGSASICLFVVMARPDPSVVRAAAMGAVGVAALGLGARGGIRALSWAVLALLLIDPWLSRMPGFVLSVVATAGILVLAPPLARRLGQWMWRPCAVALSVTLAAQLACLPALVALSGEVSIASIGANLLASAVVAPATVLGLLGGLVAVVWPRGGMFFGWGAGLCADWILTVGHQAAALNGAAVQWPVSWHALLVIVPAAAWLLIRWARSPWVMCSLCIVMVVWLARGSLVPSGVRGWPPAGWIMVACDVGQGDATVLNVGAGQAVVVDAGPDPSGVDRCLRSLGVRAVALTVLTHDHRDHVAGWPGVARGRRVGQVWVGPSGASEVQAHDVTHVAAGHSATVGRLRVEVLWPPASSSRRVDAEAANDASVVVRVHYGEVRILLAGDIEPAAQQAMLRAGTDISADVLKMPHHGSGRQDARFFQQVAASITTISAGEGNDYGHPAAAALALLNSQGTSVWRTDRDGDVAIVAQGDGLRVVTR